MEHPCNTLGLAAAILALALAHEHRAPVKELKTRSPDMKTSQHRTLANLSGIGPAMLEDFEVLGITSVSQLRDEDAADLYQRLQERTGKAHDICVLDVFECAIAQACDPDLPTEQCNWWYWSRKRKAAR